MKKLTLKTDSDTFQSMVYAIDQMYKMETKNRDDYEGLIIATMLLEWAQDAVLRQMTQEYSKPVKLKLSTAQALALRKILIQHRYDDPWLIAAYEDLKRTVDTYVQSPFF